MIRRTGSSEIQHAASAAEEVRDSILAVSKLNPKAETGNHRRFLTCCRPIGAGERLGQVVADEAARSIYVHVKRSLLVPPCRSTTADTIERARAVHHDRSGRHRGC